MVVLEDEMDGGVAAERLEINDIVTAGEEAGPEGVIVEDVPRHSHHSDTETRS